MGGPPETGPADFGPLVDKFSWYRADAALARFRKTSHGHDAVIAILGRNGNQTPQEPGADQSRGTAPLPRRFWHVAGETCRVPGEEGAGQEARDDRGDARLQASDPWRAGWTCRRRTRGTALELFVLSVLAPDHSGLTASEQPSLYWYISAPTALPVELTVMDPGTTQPLLEISVAAPIEAGIHRLRLSDHGVRLAPGLAD